MKAKEKAICEKAAELWGQALTEGYEETTDNSGLTIDIFKGAHYALGALKGFWTPSESGLVVINQAIADLERLLTSDFIEDDEEESREENSSHVSVPDVKPLVSALPASEEAPDPRVKWRITRTDDGEGGDIYTTEGVSGYSVRKYYEETKPGELIEMDGQRVLPGEIPLTAFFEYDNISDSLFNWIDQKYSFELIGDSLRSFDFLVEVYDDINEVMLFDFQDGKPTYSTVYRLQDYDYELLDCLNEVLENGDNFIVVFLERYV